VIDEAEDRRPAPRSYEFLGGGGERRPFLEKDQGKGSGEEGEKNAGLGKACVVGRRGKKAVEEIPSLRRPAKRVRSRGKKRALPGQSLGELFLLAKEGACGGGGAGPEKAVIE